jgi:hypothetical protein
MFCDALVNCFCVKNTYVREASRVKKASYAGIRQFPYARNQNPLLAPLLTIEPMVAIEDVAVNGRP